ncbi:MAG: ribonuclease P protein component [Fusobacteriaceae bacterium]|nr:ribonuclease P protein component [Fusobacteriaceae bacterium]
MRKSLTKQEILRKKKDIGKIFSSGRFVNKTTGAKLLVIENNEERTRLLICIVRKFGTAVERNKVKRLAREFFRVNKQFIEKGFDFALVIYPGKYENKERFEQFEYLFKTSKFYNKDK